MSVNVPAVAPRVPGRLPTGVMPEFTRDSLAFVLKVARRLRFRHAPGHPAATPLPAMSLRLRDGLKVIVQSRGAR